MNEKEKESAYSILGVYNVSAVLADKYIERFRHDYRSDPNLERIPEENKLYNEIEDMNQLANKPIKR